MVQKSVAKSDSLRVNA